MNKTLVAKELLAIAKSLTASQSGLFLSTHPEWDFGHLYYTFNQRLPGQPAGRLQEALDTAIEALKDASLKLVQTNPEAGISFRRSASEVNSISDSGFTISLAFDKNDGAEVVM